MVQCDPTNLQRIEQLRVRISTSIASPVTFGSGVLLPATSARWDERKLRVVLAHESSHVRQGDFYLQLCSEIYAAIFWFSPLGWWLRSKLYALNEILSDGAAVREASSHATYAQMLLEFAAMPRTNPIGVAMARPGSVSARIERLLDENRFRQAFAASPLRKLVGGLLAPALVCAVMALLQVSTHATAQEPAVQPAAAPQPPAPAATPQVTPATPPEPAEASPVIAADPQEAPVAPAAPESPQSAPPAPPAPPALAGQHEERRSITLNENGKQTHSESTTANRHSSFAYASHWGDNDEFYVLASKGWDNISCCEWMGSRGDELKRAGAMAKGDFLWFGHEGKSYIVDDPQTIAELKTTYDRMNELGRKQGELGRQQKDLGEQQKRLAMDIRKEVRLEKPDISKEMAELTAAVDALKSDKGSGVSEERLAAMQAKLAALQAKLGGMQGQMGERMGEIGANQGKLGELQGKLGEEQGRLGEEQGRLAREADHKVREIIEQSLKNGKAREVK